MCVHKPKTVSGRLREISNVEVIDVEQIISFPKHLHACAREQVELREV